MQVAANEERADKCLKKIKKVLNDFECVLVPEVKFIGDRISTNVIVRPVTRNPNGPPKP